MVDRLKPAKLFRRRIGQSEIEYSAEVRLPSVTVLRAHDFGQNAPDAVRVMGWDHAGDGGEWVWRREPSATAYNVHEQSADGLYWTPSPAIEFPAGALGFGLGSFSAATNLSAFRRGMRLLQSWGGGVFRIQAGTHPMGQTIQELSAAVHNVIISGAGRTATVLERGASTPTIGSYIYFKGCSGIVVEGLTIDAGAAVGATAHGLHFDTCTDWRVQDVHIRNFDAAAISIGDTDNPTSFAVSNFALRDISIDGYAIGRNGILVNNAQDFSISGIRGGNLNLAGTPAGAPSVGIGIKTYSRRGLIYDVNMHTLRRGCNLGAEGGVSQCRAWGLRFRDTITGLAATEAMDCHFSDVTLETPLAEPDPVGNPGFMGGQVAMRDANRCTATGINIRGGSNVFPVLYQRNTTNCLVALGLWDNAPNDAVLLQTVDTVTALRLDVDQYQGPAVVDPTTLLSLSGGTSGTRYYWRGDRILPV